MLAFSGVRLKRLSSLQLVLEYTLHTLVIVAVVDRKQRVVPMIVSADEKQNKATEIVQTEKCEVHMFTTKSWHCGSKDYVHGAHAQRILGARLSLFPRHSERQDVTACKPCNLVGACAKNYLAHAVDSV